MPLTSETPRLTCQTAEAPDRAMTRTTFRAIYSFLRRSEVRKKNAAALAPSALGVDPHHAYLVAKSLEWRMLNDYLDERMRQHLYRSAWHWRLPNEATFAKRVTITAAAGR